MKSKESYKHLLRKFMNILLKTDLKIDLKRGCALDEHQKKAQEEAIICRNQ